MKDTYLMFARYNAGANRTIYALMDKLSNEEREKERGSYYHSLSGLLRHIAGGTWFFLGIYKSALGGRPAALKALEPAGAVKKLPEGPLSPDQWRALAADLEILDTALVNLVSALDPKDFTLPVKTDWYGGNPAEVPLSFMLGQLIAHGTHHRGQVSQILDELKIDNDYSGINVALLSKK
ncbi:MAG: DinB family protein [Spirochaetaceae bacterium]|jgi:uncharacterized damage-inducible protein DinB|nr:DinB family protein [Spirochaetaceae bacterium]